jgi:hypothetical protein
LLVELDLGAGRVDGVDVAWSPRQVSVDTDEVTLRRTAADLEVQVRHSFSTGWTTRLLVVNTATEARSIERLELRLRPGPDQQVSALTAGARLCWATQSADGQGPLLTARLGAGSVSQVRDRSVELGPLRLAPGPRCVTQLRWEVVATPASVVAGPGRDVLVTRTAYAVDEAILLPADPDTALVAPRGVAVDVVEDEDVVGREVWAAAPGRHRIELRSADGDIRLDLSWVSSLADQLQRWAAVVLAGPRTPAGVVAVDDLPAAVVVQTALGADQLPDADLAAEALDRLTARLLDESGAAGSGAADTGSGGPDPLTVLYLLGEHGRTGDPDVLALALAYEEQLLTRAGPPLPGLGLAVLRTVLTVDAHDRLTPLLLHAVEQVSAPATAAASQTATSSGRAAELELLLAVRPLRPPDHPAEQRLVALVRALGAAVGAGLPGRLVTPPPVAEHAYLVAVLRMLPEEGVAGVTRSWGAAPGLLAHRLTLEVLDRLTGSAQGRLDPAGDPVVELGPAAAWLALGHRRA